MLENSAVIEKLSKEYWINKIMSNADDKPVFSKKATYKTLHKVIDLHNFNDFRSITNNNPLSEFVIFLSIYSFLLKRYYKYPLDLVFSYPFINDEVSGNQALVFYKTLCNDALSFKDLLTSLRKEVQETSSHQPIDASTLENSLAALGIDPQCFYTFSITYNLVNNNKADNPCGFQLELNHLNDQDISIGINYDSEKTSSDFVASFLNSFTLLIQNIKHNLSLALPEVAILSIEEKTEIIEGFNNSFNDYPQHKTVVDLFQEQAGKTPDAVAVISNDKRLTYQEVSKRVNRLANYLIENLKVCQGDFIGVMLGRSEEFVIALMAILKAGAAYIPVDVNYPAERIQFMLADSGINVLLTEQCVMADLEVSSSKVVILEQVAESILKHKDLFPSTLAGADDTIYAIYTSGSTGKPKGVVVKHGGFTNLLNWYCRSLEVNADSCFLLIAPTSFDLAQKNIFAPLIRGGKLYLSESLHGDYTNIASVIEAEKVTVINSAPSAFYPLLTQNNHEFNKLESLQHVVLGGEPIIVKNFSEWAASGFCHADLINSYGPTECTDVVSYYRLENREWKNSDSMPIGKPIDNTQIYILEENLSVSPIGVIGEIYISGAGIASGYLNRPELTAERFISNPFAPGSNMYKTGDLGYWLQDGNIEYVSRRDNQVKIRGFRVELVEIEYALLKLDSISAAVVVAIENKSGEKELVAYLISEYTIDSSLLRKKLKELIPEYLIPSIFIQIDEFPLTPSGKLDRKHLLSYNIEERYDTVNYVAPANDLEIKLVNIWKEVLDKENIGVEDNFFDLGGHSLSASRILSRIKFDIGVELSYRTMFDDPTIRNISTQIISLENNKSHKRIIPVKNQ